MPLTDLQEREKQFYDQRWKAIGLSTVEGSLVPIPEVDTLAGKRLLICSCGSGVEPVQAAKAGAEVYTFDISRTAVENALRVAECNNVTVRAQVMSFESLAHEADYFDAIYGSSILHHVDCARVAPEIYRCLKPGGVAYFLENSDRNPLVRWARRVAFGAPKEVQRHQFMCFRRFGTSDEYPLTDDEIGEFKKVFGEENVRLVFDEFVFFQLLYHFGLRKEWFKRLTLSLDNLTVRVVPALMKYSYDQHVWMKKPT